MQDYSMYPDSLRNFLYYMRTIKGRSPKTVDEYGLDLRLFLKYIKLLRSGCRDYEKIDNTDITDIDIKFLQKTTLGEVYDFLNYTAEVRKNDNAARARKISAVRSFFKYMTAKTGELKENPVKELDSPRIRQSLPKYLSLQESRNLLECVVGKTKERDYAIITLFLNCGLRLSELVGINISDVESDTLKVLGKGNKERSVYLNEACRNAISAYLAVRGLKEIKDQKALFLSSRGMRISPKTVQWLVKRQLEAAGLAEKGYSAHKLRHTAATLMYRYGKADVRVLQEILGHVSLSTTQIYTHVENEQVREAIINNPLSGEKSKK